MRKNILFLASLFVLTACVGGDSDCPWCTWRSTSADSGRSVAKPTALDATPDDMRQNNSNVIQSANIISSVNRILDVYEQSGLDYSNVSTDELPALAEDSGAPVFNPERKILNGLTDAQIRKLREAIYAFNWIYTLGDPSNDAELAVMIKLMNAVYNIESGGKIKNKFDPSLTMADIMAMSPQERDKLHNDLKNGLNILDDYVPNLSYLGSELAHIATDHVDVLQNTYDMFFIRYDMDGKIIGLEDGDPNLFDRQGDTNIFVNETSGEKITIDSASKGKLTYADFGYMTSEIPGDDNVYKDIYVTSMVGFLGQRLNDKIYGDGINSDMKFKGTAVGLYSKNNGDFLVNPVTMQTDNATLSVKTRGYPGYGTSLYTSTLYMPFSESGWYDVTVNQVGGPTGFADSIEFTNYKGANDTNRLSNDDKSGNMIVGPGSWYGTWFYGDNVLDLPTEAVGQLEYYHDDGDGHEDHFRAAYGMTRQE